MAETANNVAQRYAVLEQAYCQGRLGHGPEGR